MQRAARELLAVVPRVELWVVELAEDVHVRAVVRAARARRVGERVSEVLGTRARQVLVRGVRPRNEAAHVVPRNARVPSSAGYLTPQAARPARASLRENDGWIQRATVAW